MPAPSSSHPNLRLPPSDSLTFPFARTAGLFCGGMGPDVAVFLHPEGAAGVVCVDWDIGGGVVGVWVPKDASV